MTIKKLRIDPNTFVQITAILIVLLFGYAGLVKLLNLQKFAGELSLSPLIPPMLINKISLFVPIAEIGIGILFFYPRRHKLAFYLTFFLMLFFVFYIAFLLKYSSYIPCSCGGILGKMSWEMHTVFNLLFVILAGTALFFLETKQINQQTGLS